jgi:hypothetical protein
MAFTEVERSICNKLAFDSAGLLAPAEEAKGTAINQLSSIRAQLSTYVQSPQETIDAATETLETNTESIFPGDSEDDVQAMIDLIDNCDFLDGKLSNPVSLAKSLLGSLFDKLNDYLDDVGSVPEYALSTAMSALDELYGNELPGGNAIGEALKSADNLINCLSSLCNDEFITEVTDLTDQVESLYSTLGIVSDPLDANYGTLDIDTLFSDAGLTSGDIAKIEGVLDEVDSVKEQGQSSINSLVDSIVTLKKAGDITF